METMPFQVNERIILIEPYFGFTPGTSGTVVYVYPTVQECYRVRLDMDGQVHSIPYSLLTRDKTMIEEHAHDLSA